MTVIGVPVSIIRTVLFPLAYILSEHVLI